MPFFGFNAGGGGLGSSAFNAIYVDLPLPSGELVTAGGYYTFIPGTTVNLGPAFDALEIGEFINGRSTDLPAVTINIPGYAPLTPEFGAGAFQIVKETANTLSFVALSSGIGAPTDATLAARIADLEGAIDGGEAWVAGAEYKAGEVFSHVVTQTTAVDVNGDAVPARLGLFSYPVDTTSGATVTLAEIAQWTPYIINGSVVRGDDGKDYRLLACVLRNDGTTGWQILDDTNHTPVGFTGVTVEATGELVVDYSGLNAKTIGAIAVTPDERFSRGGLTAGASVSRTAVRIELYTAFSARVSGTGVAPGNFMGPNGGNTWNFSTDTALGVYTFAHETDSHSDSNGSPIHVQMDDNSSIDELRVSTRQRDGFTLQAMNRIAGEVTAAATVQSEIIGCAASWDGMTMTLTHPQCASVHDISVSKINPGFLPYIVGDSTTSIDVRFWDLVNAEVFTGTNGKAFKFMRGSLGPTGLTGGVQAQVSREGRLRVHADDVSSSSANLWVILFVEV